jgi:hypothetical protein
MSLFDIIEKFGQNVLQLVYIDVKYSFIRPYGYKTDGKCNL